MQTVNLPKPISELVGKRVLIGNANGYGAIHEAKVLEISPAGQHVRLQTEGRKEWRRVIELRLVEELTPLEPDPARVIRKDHEERIAGLERAQQSIVLALTNRIAALEMRGTKLLTVEELRKELEAIAVRVASVNNERINELEESGKALAESSRAQAEVLKELTGKIGAAT